VGVPDEIGRHHILLGEPAEREVWGEERRLKKREERRGEQRRGREMRRHQVRGGGASAVSRGRR
jgi:hypothetical protein